MTANRNWRRTRVRLAAAGCVAALSATLGGCHGHGHYSYHSGHYGHHGYHARSYSGDADLFAVVAVVYLVLWAIAGD